MNIQTETTSVERADDQHDTIKNSTTVVETRRTEPRPEKHVAKFVDKWITELDKLDSPHEFVTPRAELIEQIRYFNGKQTDNFETLYRRKADGYIEPTPTQIKNKLRKRPCPDTRRTKPRPEKYVTTRVDKWINDLDKLDQPHEFVISRSELIEQICYFNGNSMESYKTLYRRKADGYIHPVPVSIISKLYSLRKRSSTETTKTKPKSEKRVSRFVDKCIQKLEAMDPSLEFVTPRLKLIEQVLQFDGKQMSEFKTLFRRKIDGYVHPTPVRIGHVFDGNTKIWTEDEKKANQELVNAKHQPRGVDTNGNKEKDRFQGWIDDHCPKIKERFTFEETCRSSLADMIATDRDTGKSFGIQLFTAMLQSNGQCNYNKILDNIIQCIDAKIVPLGICVTKADNNIDEEVVGGYMIDPTSDFEKQLVQAQCKGTMKFAPRMLSKKITSSKLIKILEQFRYIRTKFQNGVQGEYMDLDDFQTNFLNLCDNFSAIVNTPEYLKSLFNSVTSCTEWAGNMAYENNILELVKGLKLTPNHGERGDMVLEYDDGEGFKFKVKDERKTLGVVGGSTDIKSLEWNSWNVVLRAPGHQGLDPSKVDLTTASKRSNRLLPNPNKPEDFPAIVVLPVLTADGNPALRPDDQSACTLNMHISPGEREYIRVKTSKIGANIFPESMQKIDEENKSMTKLKVLFYYDDLKNPDGKRLRELLELYTMIEERRKNIKPSAIEAYKTAVNASLIAKEKNQIKMKKEKKKTKKEEPTILDDKTNLLYEI
jgi:hypothetical protein